MESFQFPEIAGPFRSYFRSEGGIYKFLHGGGLFQDQ